MYTFFTPSVYRIAPSVYSFYPHICHFFFHFFLWIWVTLWAYILMGLLLEFLLLLFIVRQVCWQQILPVVSFLGMYLFCFYFWSIGPFLTGYRIFSHSFPITANTEFHCLLAFIILDEKSVINSIVFLIIFKSLYLTLSMFDYEVSRCRILVSILHGNFSAFWICR